MKLDVYMPVKIISGRGCLNKSVDALKGMGKECLIITSGSSAIKSGALQDAEKALDKIGIKHEIFSSITQNPYTEDCCNAGAKARKINADFIVGIGGGSPLDASKAAAIYATNPEMKPSEIYIRHNPNKPLPLVLIGTTAGTGSEVTGVSVLTDSDNNMKKSISGRDCYAKVAFCDYGYTETVPYDFTVSTALDAMAHSVESYFSSMSNSMSELYAEKSFPMLWKNLKFLCENKSLPSSKAREELYCASIYAGLALNITGACFPHTMGYILTEDYNVPHGKACAAFMIEFVQFARENLPDKADRFFSLMGTDIKEFTTVIDNLADIHIKMTNEDIMHYAARWHDPVKNFSRTPGNFTSATAVDVLKKYL